MKYLLPIIAIALFQGCAMYQQTVSYDIGMTEVERPANFEQRYADTEIVKQDSAEISKYVYQDSLIGIAWIPTGEGFNFTLENKTDYSMKIIWDEAAFVDANGQSQRVMHEGVKYADRNSSQPPTIVVRGGNISDIVIPTNSISYTSGEYGGWSNSGVIKPYKAASRNDLMPAKENIGKNMQVLLPLEIQGTVNEYLFTFEVLDAKIPDPTPRY